MESSYVSLGTPSMPETEAEAESDTGGIQGGGAISDSDVRSDSDVDCRPTEAAKEKQTAR